MVNSGSLLRSTDGGPDGAAATLASSYGVTSTTADIGLSTSVTTTAANQNVYVHLNYYLQVSTATASHACQVYLNVDGSNQPTASAFLTNANTNGVRLSMGMSWRVTLASAAAHTLKIQAVCTTSSDFTIVGADMMAIPCR